MPEYSLTRTVHLTNMQLLTPTYPQEIRIIAVFDEILGKFSASGQKCLYLPATLELLLARIDRGAMLFPTATACVEFANQDPEYSAAATYAANQFVLNEKPGSIGDAKVMYFSGRFEQAIAQSVPTRTQLVIQARPPKSKSFDLIDKKYLPVTVFPSVPAGTQLYFGVGEKGLILKEDQTLRTSAWTVNDDLLGCVLSALHKDSSHPDTNEFLGRTYQSLRPIFEVQLFRFEK